MLRKSCSALLALTGLLIGLGAFGHSFMGRRTLDAGIAPLPLDPHTGRLIYLVWYFCGGCMLVFGVLVVWSAWRAVRCERGMLFVPCAIGVFYLATGVLSLAYMHEPFWGVFVVLGGLTLVLSALLGLAPSKRQVPPTRDQARA